MLCVEGNSEGAGAKEEEDDPALANMLSHMKMILMFRTFCYKKHIFFAILFHFSTCAVCIADHLNTLNHAKVL